MRITEGRIAKVEDAIKGSPVASSGPLTTAERAELDRLLGPRPDTASMSGDDADAWLHDHSIDGGDPEIWERIAELQARDVSEG